MVGFSLGFPIGFIQGLRSLLDPKRVRPGLRIVVGSLIRDSIRLSRLSLMVGFSLIFSIGSSLDLGSG